MSFMNDNTEQLKNTLREIFEKNHQITVISLSNPTGLPIVSMERKKNGEIVELDVGTSNRFAALMGASGSLADRTLSTFSDEKTRIINIRGKNNDCSISISDYLIVLVVTKPFGSATRIAEKLNASLKGMI